MGRGRGACALCYCEKCSCVWHWRWYQGLEIQCFTSSVYSKIVQGPQVQGGGCCHLGMMPCAPCYFRDCSTVCKQDYEQVRGLVCDRRMQSFKAVEFDKACGLGKESVISRRATSYSLLHGTVHPLFPIMARKCNGSGTQVTAGFCCFCRVKRFVVQEHQGIARFFQFKEGFCVQSTFMTNSKQILV